MTNRANTRLLAAALGGALVLAVCVYAAIAAGAVIVYANSLATPREGNELHHFEGKAANCSRHVRRAAC